MSAAEMSVKEPNLASILTMHMASPGMPHSLALQRTSCAIRGATHGPESRKIQELKLLRCFDDPSMWCDNRARNWNNHSDFRHACRGEWLGLYWYSRDSSAWRRVRVQYREGEGPSFQIARTSYFETKLTGKESRDTFINCNEMHQQNISILLAALRASSSSRDLERGKEIHADAIESRADSNICVASTLVDMYANCGSMGDARLVFDKMSCHDVVSWNALMLGYAENGQSEVALQLFARMPVEGCAPNRVSFLAALKACSRLATKEAGKQVDGKLVKMGSLEKAIYLHSQAAKSGCDSQMYVANALIDMYAKCGSLVDARGVFDRIACRCVGSWTALMLGYAAKGEGEVALQLFARMLIKGYPPNRVTFLAALKACSTLAANEEGKQVDGKLVKMGSLEKGMAVHSQAAKTGCDAEIYVANSLVDMYAKCGSMVDARRVFDTMLHHSVVSWNALMVGYAENGVGEVALQLLARMRFEGCAADRVTFLAALKACTSLADKEEAKQVDGNLVKTGCLEKGMAIHSQAVKSGCDSKIYMVNILVDLYAKCGSMVDARGVFDRMPCHDVVSWNALMLGYAENGESELTLHLFASMQWGGCAPDARTFVAVLKACTSVAAKEEGQQVDGKLVRMGSLEKGMAIHSQASKSNSDSEIYVANALVGMYAKCGSMVDAHGVFDRMPDCNVVSWTALMLGYAENGEGEVALHLFACMLFEGCAPNRVTFLAVLKACTSLAEKEEAKQVDGKLVKMGSLEKGMAIHSQASKSCHDLEIYVANAMVDMYAKCGSLVDARGVFDRMPHHTVVSWTALMLGYAEKGEGDVALQLFACMKSEGCAPNALTFVAALKACGCVAALEVGKTIHADICRCGLESDLIVANCLINFYGKCGSMVDAQQVFDSLVTRDLVTWTSLITGYSRQGDAKHVFDLFERMQKERVQPDGITFLSVLTVCSHAGLVDKGKDYFQAMFSKYGITPSIDHYTSIVDLLGRANQLDDAVAMVKNMPLRPDCVIWMTVLAGCRKWTNVAVGRLAFEAVLRLDDKDAAAYVLMANIYGGAGMWEERAKIQDMRTNAWKKPGQSWWTDEAGMVHKFMVGDTSHPQSEDIHAKLKHVLVKMKEQGYVADVGSVLYDMSDDEKEDALCGHSERLAIACALLNTAPGTTIRIVKNLRVCDDCHKATAIISTIEQRSIICRDASRFHVFKDGKCSCGDFW